MIITRESIKHNETIFRNILSNASIEQLNNTFQKITLYKEKYINASNEGSEIINVIISKNKVNIKSIYIENTQLPEITWLLDFEKYTTIVDK